MLLDESVSLQDEVLIKMSSIPTANILANELYLAMKSIADAHNQQAIDYFKANPNTPAPMLTFINQVAVTNLENQANQFGQLGTVDWSSASYQVQYVPLPVPPPDPNTTPIKFIPNPETGIADFTGTDNYSVGTVISQDGHNFTKIAVRTPFGLMIHWQQTS